MEVWRGVLGEFGGFFEDAFYGWVFGIELTVRRHFGLCVESNGRVSGAFADKVE